MKEELLLLGQERSGIPIQLCMKGGSVDRTSTPHSSGYGRVLVIHIYMIEWGDAWSLIAWECKLWKFKVPTHKIFIPQEPRMFPGLGLVQWWGWVLKRRAGVDR
jgi:hypothetical protein